MSRRVITLIVGLAMIAAACGAEADPSSEARADTTPTTEATSPTTEGSSATNPQDSPPPEDDYGVDPVEDDYGVDPVEDDDGVDAEDDYGVDPEGGDEDADSSGDATPPTEPIDVGGGKVIEPVPVGDVPAPIVGETPATLMDSIMDDLAGHTGAARAAFTVVRSESVVWSDGSLGCPLPGVVYTQATVPGYWIVIDHGGTEYDYRASDSGSFVRCEGGGLPPGGNPTK